MLKLQEKDEKQQSALTVREALVVKGLLEGKTATDAMIAAGYALSLAQARPYSVIDKGRVKEALRTEMDRQGLTAERLAKAIAAGLNATQKVVVGSQVVEEPDFAMRHRFLETAIRLRGEDLKHLPATAPNESYEARVRRLRGCRDALPPKL